MNLHDFVAEPVNPEHSFHDAHTVPFCLTADHIATCHMFLCPHQVSTVLVCLWTRVVWKTFGTSEPRLRRRSQPVRAHWTTCKWRPPRNQARRSAAWLHSRIRTPSGLSDHLLNGLVCAFHVWFRLIRTRTPSDLLVYSLNNFVDFGSAVCLQLPGVTFLLCGLPLVSLVTSMAHMNRYPLSFTVHSQNSSSSLVSPPLRPPVGSEVEAKIQHASSIVLLRSVHEPFVSA